ncbi:hypothetical protein TNCV_1636741 [Trichonephila clavipes]|nr:hypothetical protein TNCV_1636741 [Trichonephila clavipes]
MARRRNLITLAGSSHRTHRGPSSGISTRFAAAHPGRDVSGVSEDSLPWECILECEKYKILFLEEERYTVPQIVAEVPCGLSTVVRTLKRCSETNSITNRKKMDNREKQLFVNVGYCTGFYYQAESLIHRKFGNN